MDILQAALDEVGTGCILLSHSHSQNLRWANSALTTNADTDIAALTVVALVPEPDGTRVAASTGQVDGPEAAIALARACRAAAAKAPLSDGAELVDAGAAAGFDKGPAGLEAGATEHLLTAVSSFLQEPDRQFGYAELDRTTTYLATSAGTRYRHVQDGVRIEASARDGAGSTWWGTNSLAADFPAAARAGARHLALQRTRADLDPGRHRVILTPSAVADLLIYLTWSASGRDAVEGHNVFARPGGGTRLGEALTTRALTLFADPGYAGLETADRVMVAANSSMESVFDNGLPLVRTELIRNGRLVSLRASRPTATRFGLEPAYLADNLILTDPAGTGGLTDLIARTDDAVLINCLWYIREVDPQNLLLTGLTRDGVYHVRDGELVAGLPNFRFNVSVTDVLDRIGDATATHACLPREWADWFTRTAMPALLIDGFNLSSPSAAL